MVFPGFYISIMYASALSVLIPILTGIIKFKTLNRIQRVLFFYLIAVILTEIANLALKAKHEPILHAVQNTFTLSEYFFLFGLFYFELNFKAVRILIIIAITVCILTFIFSFYKFDQLFVRNDLTTSVESAFMVILCVLFYILKINSDVKTPMLLEYPFFWINTGLAIYFATALVIFIRNDYLVEHVSEFRFYHTIQRLINLSSNILFAIALWGKKQA